MYFYIRKVIHNKLKLLFYIYFIDNGKMSEEFSAVKWKNVTFEVSNIDSVQRGRHGGQ